MPYPVWLFLVSALLAPMAWTCGVANEGDDRPPLQSGRRTVATGRLRQQWDIGGDANDTTILLPLQLRATRQHFVVLELPDFRGELVSSQADSLDVEGLWVTPHCSGLGPPMWLCHRVRL
jgi:hypothetical protein